MHVFSSCSNKNIYVVLFLHSQECIIEIIIEEFIVFSDSDIFAASFLEEIFLTAVFVFCVWKYL